MGKGRAPCCDKSKVKKGPWSCEEDLRLITFIQKHGHQNWRSLPKQAGLLRCGKSCRLRWINYLRPDVKRGNFTPQEEDTILKLHQSFGNKWSKIASHLPGRTDNEIKNVWNTHLKKRLHSTEAKLDDSHAINKGGELKNVNMVVNEKEEEKKCCSSYNNVSSSVEISSPNINVELRRVHADDDGVIEIPLECDDVDIWDMLDIMDPQPPNADDHSNNNDASQPVCEGLSEFECQKWFTYFENELLGV